LLKKRNKDTLQKRCLTFFVGVLMFSKKVFFLCCAFLVSGKVFGQATAKTEGPSESAKGPEFVLEKFPEWLFALNSVDGSYKTFSVEGSSSTFILASLDVSLACITGNNGKGCANHRGSSPRQRNREDEQDFNEDVRVRQFGRTKVSGRYDFSTDQLEVSRLISHIYSLKIIGGGTEFDFVGYKYDNGLPLFEREVHAINVVNAAFKPVIAIEGTGDTVFVVFEARGGVDVNISVQDGVQKKAHPNGNWGGNLEGSTALGLSWRPKGAGPLTSLYLGLGANGQLAFDRNSKNCRNVDDTTTKSDLTDKREICDIHSSWFTKGSLKPEMTVGFFNTAYLFLNYEAGSFGNSARTVNSRTVAPEQSKSFSSMQVGVEFVF
jgi:hypothetical protein